MGSARRSATATNKCVTYLGNSSREFTTPSGWEDATDIGDITSGIGNFSISSVQTDRFHGGENLSWSGGADTTYLGTSEDGLTIYYKTVSGTPANGETVTGDSSGHSVTCGTVGSSGGICPTLNVLLESSPYTLTSSFLLMGANGSLTYFRIVKPAGTNGTSDWQGHNGTPNVGVKLQGTFNDCLQKGPEWYQDIEDLVYNLVPTDSGSRSTAQSGGQDTTYIGIIVCDGSSTGGGVTGGLGSGYSAASDSGLGLAVDCLAINNTGWGFRTTHTGAIYTKHYSCSAINNGQGGFKFESTSGGDVCRDCLAENNTSGDFYKTGTVTPDLYHCASGDGTADDFGGSDNQVDRTFTFIDSGNDDYRLSPSDTGARGLGEDLSADAVYPFDDDIDFAKRGSVWDIGFDQNTMRNNTHYYAQEARA